MSGICVKKLRAMMLSSICLLFPIQLNYNISDIDLAPQLKKTSVEQLIEYEDYLYHPHKINYISATAAKKRYLFKTKHIQ